jgi:orotidine-5'-phosphate decarboxylase
MTELIVALDEPSADEALAVVEKTAPVVRWYKVGYQAYYAYGEKIIAALHERGASLFLDLKLHDIPNTVAAAVRAAKRFRPALLTLHASGGRAMMEAAAQARDEANADGGAMRLLAVTVLTSLSKEDLVAAGEDRTPHQLVSMRAELALQAGIDGAVCAVEEAAIVRARGGDGFVIVCPGIRPSGQAAGDQRRIAEPADAVLAGADYIVVGRPITAAPDPGSAARAILDELASVKTFGNAQV